MFMICSECFSKDTENNTREEKIGELIKIKKDLFMKRQLWVNRKLKD